MFEKAKRADRQTVKIPGARGNWKKCSGVLCDKKMPVKLKGKLHSGTTNICVWRRDMVNNESQQRGWRRVICGCFDGCVES